VLGGSSINGLIYIRSQPEDYDYWAQLGNRGWGWDDVLPFFKRAERWTGDEAEIHGTEGNLTTSPMTERPEACQAIIRAARELGLEYRADVNNLPRGAGDSIGWCQHTRGGRRRASAAATYLAPRKTGQICKSSPARWCIACCSTANARWASSSRASPASNASTRRAR
jgi:choline dehydrogenase